jgi:hypothetical protein
MNDPKQIEFVTAEAFPMPRWARVTAFVGLYALALAGMVGVEHNVQTLLGWIGIEGAGLTRTGVLAGIYVAAAGLRPMLYVPAERNEGLYRLACSLIVALSALATATVVVIVIRFGAPDYRETFMGGMVPMLAAAVTLAVGWVVSRIATRRRSAIAAEIRKLQEDMHHDS